MLGQRSLVFILSHFFFPGNILFRTYQSSMHTWYLRVGIYSGTEVKSSTAAAIQAALKPHPSPAGRLSGSRLGKIRDGLVTVRMYGYCAESRMGLLHPLLCSKEGIGWTTTYTIVRAE